MTTLALVTTPTQTTTPRKRAAFHNAQTRTIQQLATLWNSLTGAEQSTWKRLAMQMPRTNTKAMPSRVSAYATFIQFNSILIGAGADSITTAPATPDAPIPLPGDFARRHRVRAQHHVRRRVRPFRHRLCRPATFGRHEQLPRRGRSGASAASACSRPAPTTSRPCTCLATPSPRAATRSPSSWSASQTTASARTASL